MKRRLIACLLALCLVSAPALAEDAFRYTNLVGADVQAEVQEILTAASISRERLETLWRWVDDYNQAMASCESLSLAEGWTSAASPVVDYGDYYPASTAWFKTARRDYADILCRLAAFQLLRDGITAARPVPESDWACGRDQWLVSDAEAIAQHPLVDLTEEEVETYFTLFQPVPAPDQSTAAELARAVADAWKERGVAFDGGDASLITIWLQEEGKPSAAVAHAAVLVPWEDGYLLVEKTNPQMPYQATRFASVEEVGRYMRDTLLLDYARYGLTLGPTLVLRNDQAI